MEGLPVATIGCAFDPGGIGKYSCMLIRASSHSSQLIMRLGLPYSLVVGGLDKQTMIFLKIYAIHLRDRPQQLFIRHILISRFCYTG